MVADVQPFKEEPYGWCVVFSVFMIHIIVDGLTYSFGALYPELLVHFNATAFSTSIVMSILVGVTYGCGPLASSLSCKFGARAVTLIGAVLACAGCLLSLIATEVWHLALTYGALTGLGFGFMYLPAIVSVNSWFEARRAIAVSIAVSGSGVGTFIFNPLTTFLLKRYSLTGCMLVMAAIAILGTFFALLLRPPPTRLRVQTHQAELATIPVRNEKRMKILIRFFIWIKDAVDWRLLTDWRFFLYAASSFFGGFCSYVPYMYLSSRAVEESDLDKQDASWLMSIVGIANILGRLTSGVLSDRKIADNSALYIIACIVGGVATSVSVFCNTYLQYAVYAAFFGYTGGIIVAVQTVVLTDIVGVDRISKAFGILLLVQGIAVFVGPPFAGYLIEVTNGSYRVCFIVFGAVMCLSGILFLPVAIRKFFMGKSMSMISIDERQEESFYAFNSTNL